MANLTGSVLESYTPVVWIVLDFNSCEDKFPKFYQFQLDNQVFPEPCGGFSGMFKSSHCYSPENARKVMSWLESGND